MAPLPCWRGTIRVRLLEGLPQVVEVLHGEVPGTVEVREGSVSYDVDLRHGQKTGLFLDQRENREAAARYAHGRLLDCFSYNGGFALRLAAQYAIKWRPSTHRRTRWLDPRQRREEERCDAPAGGAKATFGRRSQSASWWSYDYSALRHDCPGPACVHAEQGVDYQLRARPLASEIDLARCACCSAGRIPHHVRSCLYHIDEAISSARSCNKAAAAPTRPQPNARRWLQKRMQGRDHPVLLGVPETYYLKCFIVR